MNDINILDNTVLLHNSINHVNRQQHHEQPVCSVANVDVDYGECTTSSAIPHSAVLDQV